MTELPAAEPAALAEPATPWAALAGVIAAVSVYAVAQGLTYPLLALILESQGHSPGVIGLSAAMTPLGFVCCAPLVPSISRRFGPAATVLGSALAGAAVLALIGVTRDLTPWFPLRFVLGVVVLPLYIVSEVWIIELAPAALRGRVLGIYTSVISAAFAIGPFTLILVGTQGAAPFAVGVGAFLVCAACLWLMRPRLPHLRESREKASVRSFLPHAPVLLLAVFVTAVVEQSSFSLMPVYGLRHGLGEAEISALVGMLVIGNVALQMPLGMLAERFPPQAVLVACAVAAALGGFLIPLAIETVLIWPLIFLWGAAVFGIYTLALVSLGARFTGSMLVAGNAAFALMWGIGGIAGPAATGAAMDSVGVEGLPLTLGLLCLALAFAAMRR